MLSILERVHQSAQGKFSPKKAYTLTFAMLALGAVPVGGPAAYAGCGFNQECSGYWSDWTFYCCKVAMNGNCQIYQRRQCNAQDETLGNKDYRLYSTTTAAICDLGADEVAASPAGLCTPPAGGG